MARRVLASYFSEDKLADTLNEFKTKGYTSQDFLIFTAEISVESIHAHTDDILERLPSIRRSTNTQPLIKEIKHDLNDGSRVEPVAVSMDKLIELGISSEDAAAYGSEADDGNILILVNEEGVEDTGKKDTNTTVSIKPGDQTVNSTDTDTENGN